MSFPVITQQPLSQHRHYQGQPEHRALMSFASRQDRHQRQLGNETARSGIPGHIARNDSSCQQRGTGRGGYQQDPRGRDDPSASSAALEQRPIVPGKGKARRHRCDSHAALAKERGRKSAFADVQRTRQRERAGATDLVEIRRRYRAVAYAPKILAQCDSCDDVRERHRADQQGRTEPPGV